MRIRRLLWVMGSLFLGLGVAVLGALPAHAAGITIAVSDGLDQVATGDQVSYTITITNQESAQEGVTVSLETPSYTTVTSAEGGAVKDATVTWEDQEIAAGGTWSEQVMLVVGDVPADAVRAISVASVTNASGVVLVANSDADRIQGHSDPDPATLVKGSTTAEATSASGPTERSDMLLVIAAALSALALIIGIFAYIRLRQVRKDRPAMRRTRRS